jgi:hypothetical protein
MSCTVSRISAGGAAPVFGGASSFRGSAPRAASSWRSTPHRHRRASVWCTITRMSRLTRPDHTCGSLARSRGCHGMLGCAGCSCRSTVVVLTAVCCSPVSRARLSVHVSARRHAMGVAHSIRLCTTRPCPTSGLCCDAGYATLRRIKATLVRDHRGQVPGLPQHAALHTTQMDRLASLDGWQSSRTGTQERSGSWQSCLV